MTLFKVVENFTNYYEALIVRAGGGLWWWNPTNHNIFSLRLHGINGPQSKWKKKKKKMSHEMSTL